MKGVYLDYAATTPVDEKVLAAILPYFTENFGNPSSLYSYGRTARQAVAKARAEVADLIGAAASEIFFTSGGSESDNWALKGMAFKLRREGKGNHIITSAIEHHAILNVCAYLEQEGFNVTYLPVDDKGRINPSDVVKAITADTIIVSLMLANNEVGTIEPIAAIGKILREKNIFFHTDAVQAVGHIAVNVNELQVDALSLSGHKIYAPKGIGALYLRRGIQPDALIHGGAQERAMRAGTENVAGIVGLGAAAVLAKNDLDSEKKRLSKLRDILIAEILKIPRAYINGDSDCRLPHNVSFGVENIPQDTMLIRLDMAGFAVSAGSACSAGSLEPSHVLLAMGQTPKKAASAIRVTIGRYTTAEDITSFIKTLREIIHFLAK